TVQHELFHLLVRSTFGDIPQWLDEGMAAVYESSVLCQSEFYGEANWRSLVLDSGRFPALAEVLKSTSYAFDEPGPAELSIDGENAGASYARNMAAARYFALFLQDRKLLGPMLQVFRDRVPGRASETGEIVGRLLGRSMDTIQVDFESWYSARGR